MKIIYTHHIPYRHLPADFRQREAESVVTNSYFDLADPKLAQADINNALDEAMHAARLGFDALGMTEHSQSSYDMQPNPDLAAAALAYAIEKEGLNVGIYTVGRSLGKSKEPLRIAEEQAWLDTLSGGRLICGFPVGLAYDANVNAGIPPIQTRARYDENLELILRAWTDPNIFPFNGKFTQLPKVNIWPRPFQRPHPPVNITGTGNPATTRFALERDLGFNLVVFGGPPGTAERIFGDMWRLADQMGLDDNPYRANFAQFVCVAETDADAEKLYSKHVEYCFGSGIGYIPFSRLAMPGGISPQGLRVLLSQAVPVAGNTAPKYKDLVDNGVVIAGSAATVRERLAEQAKAMRTGNLLVTFQLGSMPTDLARYNMDTFAKNVMPHLKPIWSEYDDTNRWWPTRLGGKEVSHKQADVRGARLS